MLQALAVVFFCLLLPAISGSCLTGTTDDSCSTDASLPDNYPSDSENADSLYQVKSMHGQVKSMQGQENFIEREHLKRYMFEGPFNIGTSTHEQINHLALVQAGLVTASDFDHLSVVPYLRGNIWNDDPRVQMFDNSDYAEWDWSTGYWWAYSYQFWKYLPTSDLFRRSHFGDMQFIHSMTENSCECPSIIKQRLMRWAEFTFKVATGSIDACTRLNDVTVDGNFNIGGSGLNLGSGVVGSLWASPSKGADMCSCRNGIDIPGSINWPNCNRGNMYTVGGRRRWWAQGRCRCTRDCTLGGDNRCHRCSDWSENVKKRAAGSLIHMLSDSYAFGHTAREDYQCKNSKDNRHIDGNKNCGAIVAFNNYIHQDGDVHKGFDTAKGTNEVSNGGTRSRATSFDKTPGALEALAASAMALKLIKDGASWSQAADFFRDNVWRLASITYPAGVGMGAAWGADGCRQACPSSLMEMQTNHTEQRMNAKVKNEDGPLEDNPEVGIMPHLVDEPFVNLRAALTGMGLGETSACVFNIEGWRLGVDILSLRRRLAAGEDVEKVLTNLTDKLAYHNKNVHDDWIADRNNLADAARIFLDINNPDSEEVKSYLESLHGVTSEDEDKIVKAAFIQKEQDALTKLQTMAEPALCWSMLGRSLTYAQEVEQLWNDFAEEVHVVFAQ